MDGVGFLTDPLAWAQSQFGSAELGDARRTRRAVWFAARAAADSRGSIPRQAGSAAGMKAVYRLFDASGVTHSALTGPHAAQTRALAGAEPMVFLVQDTTELDFSTHRACRGLAPVGSASDGRQMGLHQQSVLAVSVATRLPLGLLYQRHHRRKARPREHRTDRSLQRKTPLSERESAWWVEAIESIGPPPPGVRWVHIGDRGEDCFQVYHAASVQGTDWLIRAGKDRRVTTPAGQERLFDYARSLATVAQRSITVRGNKDRSCRTAELSVASGRVRMDPVRFEPQQRGWAPVECAVVRVFEPRPPKDATPLEWVLLTSLPAASGQEALAAAEGYAARWMIEEFHKCLKTGCAVESRRLEDTDRLEPLIGLLSVLAVWLLTLKMVARDGGERSADRLLDPVAVAVMAGYLNRPARGLTVAEFWRGIGLLGGHVGRKGDGPIGWLRAWHGCQRFNLMLAGASIANAGK